MLEDATRGTHLAELAAIGREHALAIRNFESVLGGPTFRSIREITEQNRRFADTLRTFITPEYVQSLQATAKAITETLPKVALRTYEISDALRFTLKGVSESLEAQIAPFRDAIQQPAWLETLGAITAAAAAMQPTLDALARAAEVQWHIEAGAPWALNGEVAIETVAGATIEANEALLSLAGSHTPRDQVLLIARFFQTLASLFDRLRANTIKEVQEAGLFFLISTALVLVDVIDRMDGTSLGPEDRAQFEEVQNGMRELREQLTQVEALASDADAKFVDGLPKAEIRVHANVRIEPSQSSVRIQRLTKGDVVAVADRRGRWRHIVFRDALTNSLAMGWVYSSSVQPL